MRYRKEIVSRARAQLAQQKADKESLYAARLQQAYRKVPRLQQIDIQLRGSMASVAQKAFSQGTDVKAAMDALRQENLALQKEYRDLVAEHFPADYLDDSPICGCCGGSGYIGSTMCDCLQQLCLVEQRRELGSVFSASMRFETFRLDYYPETVDPKYQVSARALMTRNLENCRRYARSFGVTSGNLLFNGGTGLGKTHLALAVGAAVGEQGYTVCYETAISLFSKLERAKFYAAEDNLAQAQKLEVCDLLIVDDLGTEMPGQFVSAALYGLLNDRLMNGRPMLITTNLNVDEVGKRYSPQIASRLYGEFTRLPFLGSDIRVLKNKF